jgi:hypothetical protein
MPRHATRADDRDNRDNHDNRDICASCGKALETPRGRAGRAGRDDADDDDDLPIVALVGRDTEWRAPGRGKVYEIHKIVDWKIDAAGAAGPRGVRSIFFLVWWKGYALRESTWEPASGIHPAEQVRFFKSAGIFD